MSTTMDQAFRKFLSSSREERIAVYEGSAAAIGTRAQNVEKDLYVCWVLDFLFNRRPDKSVGLYFKGGTSLSKAFGLIRRFSEDIDIGIFKDDLMVPNESDIAALRSNNQRQKTLETVVDEAARSYVSGPLLDMLKSEIRNFEEQTGIKGHFSLDFGYDAHRGAPALDILLVKYKSDFDVADAYVEAAVRIEGGARPDPEPAELCEIVPYIGDEIPDLANELKVPSVMTVLPERTFWEKVLILHAMTETTLRRSQDSSGTKKIPDLNRYSRHYYDVHQIWTNESYGRETASDLELAEACRRHKDLMFRAPDHGYEKAVPGTYNLVPTDEMRQKLKADYTRMSTMIFGEPPTFEEVMASIDQLQEFVNRGPAPKPW